MSKKKPTRQQNEFPTGPLLTRPSRLSNLNSSQSNFTNLQRQNSKNMENSRRSKRPKRLDISFKSLSVRGTRNYSNSVVRRGGLLGSELTKSDEKFKELDENVVMMIRDQERIANVKCMIEKYRDLMDSYDFPHKIKTRLLRNSNRHKIKNLKNFQYSLGEPKKVVFDKTPINIYGHRGDLVYSPNE